MCGIVGYVGTDRAQPILLDCLSKLEYRGYDSCGIAVGCSPLAVCKDVGRVEDISKDMNFMSGNVGVGHTRWATHGGPSRANAHPHSDCNGKIAVVHNGIIDNYVNLRRILINEGHLFVSETDTEVIPHLIEKNYHGDLESATRSAMDEISGTYAIVVVSEEEKSLVAARKGSPLIIGVGDHEYIVASDVPAVLNRTNRIIYLEDDDMAVLTKDGIHITNKGLPVTRPVQTTSWDAKDIQKLGFEHFMLKEIHEQPQVVRSLVSEHVGQLSLVGQPVPSFDKSGVLIVACGTSYNAGLIVKNIIEELTRIPVYVDIASEINTRRYLPDSKLVIGISQSGETADVLTALGKLKAAGATIVAISNVYASSITRIADQTFYTKAGPEVSVAATKTFIAQVITLSLLALSQANVNRLDRDRLNTMMAELPEKIQQTLDSKLEIKECARGFSKSENIFLIARGLNVPCALEAALKLKEVAYVHAEGYNAGELKHGPFALLSEKIPVMAVVARDESHRPMINTIEEIRARRAPIIVLAEDGDRSVDDLSEFIIRVPATHRLLSPILNVVALQLFAYYIASFRGCSIDRPRNLAKSVTVE
jgi:glutamine---fructose-6-phosphate transaminase (isomerizing)